MSADALISKSLDILVALIAVGVGHLAWVMRDIRTQVHLTNGRLSRLEQWQKDHELRDDDRFDHLTREVDRHGGRTG